jgi:hypothetical protein
VIMNNEFLNNYCQCAIQKFPVCNLVFETKTRHINSIEAEVIRSAEIETTSENRSSNPAPAFFVLVDDAFGASSKLGHLGATRTSP